MSTSYHTPPRDDLKEKTRETAREVVDELTYDHRWCANCFSRIREVENPDLLSGGKKPPEWLVGRQYPTGNTQTGVDDTGSETPAHADKIVDVSENHRLKQICECGATKHDTRRRPLPKDRLIEVAQNLSDAVWDLREEYLSGSREQVAKARKWSHDPSALPYAVGELKSKPDLQFRDQRILIRSLAIALRHE
jgi:hypothetical protein